MAKKADKSKVKPKKKVERTILVEETNEGILAKKFDPTKFEAVSPTEVCEECGKPLTWAKWICPEYPSPDLYGYFCMNPDCILYQECQQTQGKAPTRMNFFYETRGLEQARRVPRKFKELV